MVEVFKTNVGSSEIAEVLIDLIHANFEGYTANFDLEDCDLILRVQCNAGTIESFSLIQTLRKLGYDAELLHDEVPETNSGIGLSYRRANPC